MPGHLPLGLLLVVAHSLHEPVQLVGRRAGDDRLSELLQGSTHRSGPIAMPGAPQDTSRWPSCRCCALISPPLSTQCPGSLRLVCQHNLHTCDGL